MILFKTKKPDFPNQLVIFLESEKYSIFFEPININNKLKIVRPNNR